MLISCPKCHCIYEVPEGIIKKTGANLRCHTCSNIWHAMPEDALDYHAEEEDTPYIEAIDVNKTPYRHFPADKKEYIIPADSKSGAKTRSSAEVIKQESTHISKAKTKAADQEEITLTSDYGTSFTISAAPELGADDENKKTPWLNHEDTPSIHPQEEDRLRPEKSFRGYKKTCAFLILLLIALLSIFLRRDIVAFYPEAEEYYNKIYLSGLNNAEYLRFENLNLSTENIDNKEMLHLKAEIVNTSRYNSYIPEIHISGVKETFKADRTKIKAHEKAFVDVTLPKPEENSNHGLTLSFVRP